MLSFLTAPSHYIKYCYLCSIGESESSLAGPALICRTITVSGSPAMSDPKAIAQSGKIERGLREGFF